ncbi:hypothetical protein ACFVXQ_27315, partial [Kitasatospora sp. NPDC058263]
MAAESCNAQAAVMRSMHRFESSAAARRSAAAAAAADRTASFLLDQRVAAVARIRAAIAARAAGRSIS